MTILTDTLNQIEITSDYHLFSMLVSNRLTNRKKIDDIKKSFSDKISISSPITVNEKFQIIDGQHRFMACSELKKPIHFIITNGLTISHAIEMNKRKGDWGIMDFVKSFAARNNIQYNYLLGFTKRNKLPLKASLILIFNRPFIKNELYNEIRGGILKINNKKMGDNNLKLLEDFSPYFKHYTQTNFISAFIRIKLLPNYDHNALIKKLDYCRDKLFRTNTRDKYEEMLINIYNYKLQKKAKIFILKELTKNERHK